MLRRMGGLAVLINIALALITFWLYVKAGRRFYRREEPFLGLLAAAVVFDVVTAFLASFKVTPTTVLEGPHLPPWGSPVFLLHISTSTLGMFGYIAVLLALLIKGKDKPWDRMRKFQFRILLPCWVIGEIIALTNAIVKFAFHVRIYDRIRF